MKHFYSGVVFIFLVFLSFSCKKEKASLSQSVVGTWELRTDYNGQGGSTNYPPGNGRILKFTATAYEMYLNGQLQKSGVYELVKDSFYIMGKTGERIIYDNEQNSIRTFVEVSEQSLFLVVDADDGPSVKYGRLE